MSKLSCSRLLSAICGLRLVLTIVLVDCIHTCVVKSRMYSLYAVKVLQDLVSVQKQRLWRASP